MQPDVAVPATEALTTAQMLALRRLLEIGAATPQGLPRPLLDEVQRALGELTQVAPQPPVLPTPVPPVPPSPPLPLPLHN